MQLITNDVADWKAESEIIAVSHTNAGHVTLHDKAYNALEGRHHGGHNLASVDLTPVRIIAGARDPVVPSVKAGYLHERLPKSELDSIDALRFIWEDAADTYAALVTSWWDGGYTNAGSRR
jgi:pimeloyl-ACP methyl ester carboxylesterase